MEYRRNVRPYDKGKLRHPETDLYTTGRLSSDGTEYICNSCWAWLCAGKMPAQCQHNNMAVPSTPEELSKLNDLETRLLCSRYPFMKIVSLPTGGQAGIQGSVVNVPVDVHETCASLPHSMHQWYCSHKAETSLEVQGTCHVQIYSPSSSTVSSGVAEGPQQAVQGHNNE